MCKMILHHIEKLEHLLAELYKSLRPGAILYVDEYVFDSRNNAHTEILNALTRVEEILTKQGTLPDIFKVYILRNDK